MYDVNKGYGTLGSRVDIAIPPKKIYPDMGTGSNPPTIEITHLWPLAKMRESEIQIEARVPKNLSILPPVNPDSISSTQAREEGKVYIQIGDEPSYATLEQIKNLNTKTVFVDELTDTTINQLSNEDIVMLKKE